MNSEVLARMPGSFQALAQFALKQTAVEKEKDAAKIHQDFAVVKKERNAAPVAKPDAAGLQNVLRSPHS